MDLLSIYHREFIEKAKAERQHPKFNVGDTIEVHVKVSTGSSSRVQVFKGVCIGITKGGFATNFTVRKISYGMGIERTFPIYAPCVTKIVLIQEGDVRRAKIYYLRDRVGKKAKVKPKKTKIQDALKA